MTKPAQYFCSFVSNKLILIYLPFLLLFALVGCSLVPPVQEMSNARQSIQAAETAKAEVYDYKRFSQAKALLEQASKQMDLGEYEQARELAIRARAIAIKSRQLAVNKK